MIVQRPVGDPLILCIMKNKYLFSELEKRLSESGVKIRGRADSAKAVFESITKTDLPDLAMVDIKLGGASDTARRLWNQYGIPSIMIVDPDDEDAREFLNIQDNCILLFTPIQARIAFLCIQKALHRATVNPDKEKADIRPKETDRRKGKFTEASSVRSTSEKLLLPKEEQYRQLIEGMNEGLAVQDQKGIITFVNNRLCEMTSFSKRELLGSPSLSLFDEENTKHVLEQLEKRRTGEEEPYETKLKMKGGEDLFVRISPKVLRDDKGDYAGSFGVFTDITDLKKTSDALKESEERYRLLADYSRDLIVMHSNEGVIRYASPAVSDLLGYRPDEAVGKKITDFFYPEDIDELKKNLAGVIAGTLSGAFESLIRRKDEGNIWIETIGQRIIDRETGKTNGLVAVSRDITKRKKIEEKLKESEERYRQLVDNAPAGIYVIDIPKMRFSSVNDVICEYTGYRKEELLQMNPFDLLTEESKKDFFRRQQETLGGNNIPDTTEYGLKTKGGKTIWALLNTRIFYEKGKPVRASVVAYDITERKLADETLKESEERYRFFFNNALIGLIRSRISDGTIIEANLRAAQIFGYENIDRFIDEFVPSTHYIDPDAREHFFNTPNTDEIVQNYEAKWKRSDGKAVWTRANATIYPNRNYIDFVIADISEEKRAIEELKKAHDALEEEVDKRTSRLRETNIALEVLLKKREYDKKNLEDNILFNIRQLIQPYIDKIKTSKLDNEQEAFLNILESNMHDITSPFTSRLSTTFLKFTPGELQIANLIKQGRRTKEIANILGLSSRTIETHRNNIRKKLGILNKKENLRTHLLSIQ